MPDISSISDKISALRKLTQKDSISPESVGEILQDIANIIATLADKTNVDTLTSWMNKILANSATLADVQLGSTSDSAVFLSKVLINVRTGLQSLSADDLKIPAASEDTAGLLSAEKFQLIDSLKSWMDKMVQSNTLLHEIKTGVPSVTVLNLTKSYKNLKTGAISSETNALQLPAANADHTGVMTPTQVNSLTELSEWMNGLDLDNSILSDIDLFSSSNEMLLSKFFINLKTGVISHPTSALKLRTADSKLAGFMSASQARLLDEIHSNILNTVNPTLVEHSLSIANLQNSVDALSASDKPSSSSSSTSLNPELTSPCFHIGCNVIAGVLYVSGASALKLYTPFIFRYTKKHNHRGSRSQITPRTLPQSKGWHLFGGNYTAVINQDYSISFQTGGHMAIDLKGGDYTEEASALVNVGSNESGEYVSWGRNQIPLVKNDSYRRVKLKFAIAFGKPRENLAQPFDFSSLVTNLAQFSVLFDPINRKWLITK
jgi:hypothetical protein